MYTYPYCTGTWPIHEVRIRTTKISGSGEFRDCPLSLLRALLCFKRAWFPQPSA